MIFNILIFVIFAALWVAFAVALVARPHQLDALWAQVRALPLLIQVVLALLFLPIALALWVWQSRWAVWLRLVLVAGLAWFNLYAFFPRV